MHSANSVYYLDGKVPDMYMSSNTADISQVCKLAWYNWIIYHPDTIDYPDEPLHRGKYLGPVIDLGLAMTTNILQHDSKVVCRSMNQPITIKEMADP